MVKISVLYRKITHINGNLKRLKSKQHYTEEEFLSNLDIREIVLLNLQQAIQGCVDIGTHIIADEDWGVPGSLSEVFYKLEEHEIIPTPLVELLIPMVGFRNLIIHQYEEIDFRIVYHIFQNRIQDIEAFLDAVQSHFPP